MAHTKFSHLLGNAFLHVAIPLVLNTFGQLNAAWTRRFARLLGALVRICYRPGTRLVRENLAIAFPEKSAAECEKLLRKNFFHLMWVGLDFLRLLRHPERLEEMLENPHEELKAELPSQGVLCLPHLGSWEVLAQSICLSYQHCAAVAAVFDYDILNRTLERSRSYRGLKLIPRQGAVRGCLEALNQGYCIGTLIDQNLSPRHGGIFIDFFGLPATASPLPALLHRRTGIPLLSGACVHLPDGKYRFLRKSLTIPPEATDAQVTQLIISANEELIRQHPEQYVWMYRRWSTIPENASPELVARYPTYAKIKPARKGRK